MSLSGKLQKWTDAGLISADQRAGILEHERKCSSGRWRGGVTFAGLFSILLGIALVIAANWQEIPWETKLVVHFTVNTVLAALVWNWRDNPAYARHREVALFFLWGLTLTLIALIGQVFQLGGQALDAVRIWVWLTAPMIFLFAQGAFTARLWVLIVAIYLPWDIFAHIETWTDNENLRLVFGLETALGLPVAAWLAGSWPRLAGARDAVAQALRMAGIAGALIAASAAGLLFYGAHDQSPAILIPAVYAAAMIVIRFLLQRLPHWTPDQRRTIDLLCLAGLFVCIPLILWIKSSMLGMLHFMGFWLAAGAVWQQAGRDRLVSLAIALLTLRLFIGFIELFGSMMMSGFGFILGGLVLLGLVRLARAVNRRLKGQTS